MKMRSIRKKGRALLCVFLCLAMLFPLAGCGKGKKDAVMVVENAEDAIVQMAQLGGEAGYENALSELTEKSVATIDGDSYYRLQQNYQGIPVYGRTVVCAADEKGNVTSVTGNVADIDVSVDLIPTVTEDQVRESIIAYMAGEMGLADVDDLQISPLSDENLYIYGQYEDAQLIYTIIVGSLTFIVDAQDGEVLSFKQTIASSTHSPDYGWRDEDGSYVMGDKTRNIYIYSAGGMTYWDIDSDTINPDVLTLVRSQDNIFGNADDTVMDSMIGDAFLNTLCGIYDFFAENVKDCGPGVFAGIYYDSMGRYCGDNAGGGYELVDSYLPGPPPGYDTQKHGDRVGVIIAGHQYNDKFDESIVTFAHEFMHVMSFYHADWNYGVVENADGSLVYSGSLEAGAINEGLSDIFGVIVAKSLAPKKEAWKDEDWIHGNRTLYDPSINKYPERAGEISLRQDGRLPLDGRTTDYAHGYSTVISHAAYLMWNGIDGDASKKISTDDLAKLWYRAMLMMPSDCDFAICRQMVEWAALSVDGLTKEQRKCISEAFDAVGIRDNTKPLEILLNCDRNITKGDALLVYDIERELQENYMLHISGTIAEDELAYSGEILSDLGWRYQETFKIDKAQAFPLNLPNGYYTFTVTDKYHPDHVYSFTVSVTDAGTDGDIELYTEFLNYLEVQIDAPHETVNANSEWNVYGADGQLYDDYTLQIYGKHSLRNYVDTSDVEEPDSTVTEYAVNSAEPLSVSLEVGFAYTFEFIDNKNPENRKVLLVSVKTNDPLLTSITDVETDFGQSTNSPKQLTSVVVTENGGKYREITLNYDGKGRISEITDRYLGEAGEPDSVSVERFIYDAQGNLIRRESEYPEYGDYTFVDEYVYDNHGNLVSSTIEDSGGWSNNTYEYNSKGQMIRATEECQIYILVTEYAYNSEGICTGAVLTYDQFGTVWSVDCTYEYDSQQRLSRIVKVSGEGTETESYEYDDQGRETKITTETPWNSTYRTLNYDYSPFVIQQYEGGETYLELDHWTLFLGSVKMHTDTDGYLISAEFPEMQRIYLFNYDDNSQQESTASARELVSDAFSDYGVCDNGQVNNYRIPKINIAGDAAEKTNAAIYKDLYDGVYKKIKNRSGGSSGITYSWLESNGIISILAMWAPEDYTGHGPIYFKTYNASSETGAVLSLEQLAQVYGLTDQEFYALVKEKAEELFDQINGSLANAEWAKSYYKEYKADMISDKNIKSAMPFISESGDLCIVLTVYYVGTMEFQEELINLTGTTAPEVPAFAWDMPEEANTEEWKDLYAAYIEGKRSYFFDIYDSYTIAYVDDDDIPEILLTSSSAMPGSAILWITNGVVNEKSEIGYGSIHYYEKQGLVCTSWMNHGNYADTIYTLSNGEFTKLHRGCIYEDGSYEWDDQSVTREQYNSYLRKEFDRSIALEINYDVSVDTLIADILNWN